MIVWVPMIGSAEARVIGKDGCSIMLPRDIESRQRKI